MTQQQRSFCMALGLAVLLVFTLSVPADAHQTSGRHHKTKNGTGCSVSHSHWPQCSGGICANGYACPGSDAACESNPNMSSGDRVASWGSQYNCHGRTFDNRGSWTGDAYIYVSCGNGACPINPQVGDAILWDDGHVHSVTIVGAWNGTSTLVSSKYGCCGEYRHSLQNVINVYGSDWWVSRHYSSPVFQVQSRSIADEAVPVPSDPAEIDALVQTMPWYDTVVASAVEYAIEHPRMVRENGKVSDEIRKKIRETEDPKERLALLAEDLRDERHYTILATFNRPQDSLDFIAGIEAGKALVKVAEAHPERARPDVVNLLEGTLFERKSGMGAQAAALFFLDQILEREERQELQERLKTLETPMTIGDTGRDTVLGFYVRSLAPRPAEQQ